MDLSRIPKNVMFDCGDAKNCLKALERIENEYGLDILFVEHGERFTLVKLFIDGTFSNFTKDHVRAHECSVQPVSKLFDILNELKGQFEIGERVICSDDKTFSYCYEGVFAGYVDERIEIPEKYLVKIDGIVSISSYAFCKRPEVRKEVEVRISNIIAKFTEDEYGVEIKQELASTKSPVLYLKASEFESIIKEYQKFKNL